MVSKFRSGSHILMYGFNTNNKESFNKFINVFNESYNQIYLTSNWNDLKRFVNESFIAFESLTQNEYFNNAESLLINNFNTLSAINYSLNTDDLTKGFISNNDLLYSNIVSNLVLSSCVKIHDNYSELENPELDLLVTKYDIYTSLYLSLVDSCIKLYEFDNAVEKLIQLGIVQYYLRIEMDRCMIDRVGGSKLKPLLDFSHTHRDLSSRGIYMFDSGTIDGPGIIRHVIDYWKNQIDLEVWSLLVKILFNIDCIYNLLNKIETLPISLRLKIIFSVKFIFCSDPLPKNNIKDHESNLLSDRFDYDYEDFDSFGSRTLNNAVHTYLNDNKSRYKIMENISKTHIISHVFSCNFNLQCFLIEGILMFSHLCKDFFYDIFQLVYSILFDVLQIFISINSYFKYYNKKEIADKLLYGCLGLCRMYFKHYNFIPPTLQLVYNQYRLDRQLNAVSSDSLMPRFIKDTSLLTSFKNPILGFCKVSSVLKSDLEYNFLFHSSHGSNFGSAYYEYFVMNPNTPLNNYRIPIPFHLNFNDLTPTSLKHRLTATNINLGTLVINGSEISKFSKSQDMYNHFHFIRSLYNMSSNVRIKNITNPKYSSRYYGLYLRYESENNWMVRRFPDNILTVIISCCFLIDDIYNFIHYSQSLEYLQYKDTLKSKNRAIVKTLLPFVPNRSSKDAKKILTFQKHIKSNLKFNLMSSKNFIPFIPNLTKNYTPLSKILFNSDIKPKCEIYVKNQEKMGSNICFKISVTRDIRSSLSVFRVKRLKNPLLSSSKASYGHLTNNTDFKNNRNNRKSIHKYNCNLNVFLNTHTVGENTDNNRFFGSTSKCIHSAMGSSFKECNFCDKLNSFKHISHLLNLIDLLGHNLFTLNLGCSLDYSIYFKNETLCMNSLFNQQSFDIIPNVIFNMNDLSTYFSSILSQVDKTFASNNSAYHKKNDYPYQILKEIIENAILLSLSTVFHEKYYNHLISRLALYHLIKGRFNTAISLIKQTLLDSNMYIIDYGSNCSNLDQIYGCDMDRHFKIQLLGKIYIEISNDLYSFRRLCDSKIAQDDRDDQHDKAGKVSTDDSDGHYHEYRMDLMNAFTYLIQLPSMFMESISIIDSNYRQLDCDFTGADSLTQLFPNTPLPSYNDKYRSTLKLATESLLNCVSLDPLDYKAWYYLAQSSLYSNDLHFSYMCCERSIECFDSCVASWITKIICNSTRIRTCSPFYTNDETWADYGVKSSFEDSISFKSLPSPLEPLFPLNVNGFDELKSHLNNCVGDELEHCIYTLTCMDNYKDIYVASAILQLVTRNHKNFNPFFPWELSYLDTDSKFKNRTSQNYDNSVPGMPRNDRFSAGLISNVKKMVSSSVESSYPVCVVPFMNLILEVFLKRQINLRCKHHSTSLFSYNSTALSKHFLDQELYGWVTCIECLTQIGQHEISQMLLPILDTYIEYYSLNKDRKRNEKNVCKQLNFNKNFKKIVEAYFSNDPVVTTDFGLESKYLGMYIYCYNTSGSYDSLRSLLHQIRRLNSRNNYRKFSLLENRLLVGMKEYNKSVQLGNQLHRNTLKISQSTDFDLEYRSLLAFAHSLKMVGEMENSNKISNFSKQLYLTAPVLKLDLCLNIPL